MQRLLLSLIIPFIAAAVQPSKAIAAGDDEPGQYPAGFDSALAKSDFATAFALLGPELARCEAELDPAPACLNLYLSAGPLAGRKGEPDIAEQLARKAVALAGAKQSAPLDLANGFNNLAASLSAQGRMKEAERHYREAAVLAEQSSELSETLLANIYNNLAFTLKCQRKFDEAEIFYRKALAIRQSVSDESPRDVAGSLHNLATLLALTGRVDEAEKLELHSIALLQKILPKFHPDLGTAYKALGSIYLQQDRVKEAYPLFLNNLAIKLAVLPPDHPDIALAYLGLSENLVALGRTAEVRSLLAKALEIARKLPPTHPYRLVTQATLAALLSRDPASLGQARDLYSDAAAGTVARLNSFRDYGSDAMTELLRYRPIFTGQVQVAWQLAQQSE